MSDEPIIPDTYYFYNLLRGEHVLINPQNFIIRVRQEDTPKNSSYEIRISTNQTALEKIAQRFISDGGIKIRNYHVLDTETGEEYTKRIPEETGELSQLIESGIIQVVETREKLIKRLRKSPKQTLNIAKTIYEEAIAEIQPRNIEYGRLNVAEFEEEIESFYDDDDDNDDNDDNNGDWDNDDNNDDWGGESQKDPDIDESEQDITDAELERLYAERYYRKNNPNQN